MDEDWDEELMRAAEELEAELNMGIPQATYRATVSESRIQLVSRGPHLASTGSPVGTMFAGVEESGVTIADLASSRNGEAECDLTVTFLAAGNAEAEETIAKWAALVGYQRVWFPDQVVTAGPAPAPGDQATVTCPNCRHVWTGSGRDFWDGIEARHAFPPFCLLCGGDLPQWKLVRRPSYYTDCPPYEGRGKRWE